MSDLDEAGRAASSPPDGAERLPIADRTLRLDLRERLERIEAELRQLRTALAELPSVIRRSVWSKLG